VALATFWCTFHQDGKIVYHHVQRFGVRSSWKEQRHSPISTLPLYTVKERLAIFSSPINYSPPGRVWLVTRTGKPVAFFIVYVLWSCSIEFPQSLPDSYSNLGPCDRLQATYTIYCTNLKKLNIHLSTGTLFSCIHCN